MTDLKCLIFVLNLTLLFTDFSLQKQCDTYSPHEVQLLGCHRQSAPGQSECQTALQHIDGWINHLDQASLAAVGQSLAAQHDGSLAGFQEQAIASARQLLQQVEPIRHAAKGEAGNLERYVCIFCYYGYLIFMWRLASELCFHKFVDLLHSFMKNVLPVLEQSIAE